MYGPRGASHQKFHAAPSDCALPLRRIVACNALVLGSRLPLQESPGPFGPEIPEESPKESEGPESVRNSLERVSGVSKTSDILFPYRSLTPPNTPPNTPKRTRNRAETEPKRSQIEPKRSRTEPKWTEIKFFGVGRAGGLSG